MNDAMCNIVSQSLSMSTAKQTYWKHCAKKWVQVDFAKSHLRGTNETFQDNFNGNSKHDSEMQKRKKKTENIIH